MKEALRKIIENIFNNWSALQLAVDHSMGGQNSKQIAVSMIDYVVDYCITTQDIEKEDIEDVLEDIMDQEFNTICEDDSIKEISHLIIRFLQLLREGNGAQCEVEFSNLPTGKQWLSQSQSVPQPAMPADVPSSSSNEVMMEEDPEWTQVRTRRKK